jgi:hypothetical protein
MAHCGKITQAPEHLTGMWKTHDSKYIDRSFKIEPQIINFQTGEDQFEAYPIIEIRTKKGSTGENDFYTISYSYEGRETRISFYYEPKDRGVIRFPNQTQIAWKKEGK